MISMPIQIMAIALPGALTVAVAVALAALV